MPKRSRQQIAEDEKRILTELQKNANESIDTIAKHCKFSRQKVWRSIKRLEHDHIIWGYTAIVDDTKQDHKHYVTLIKKTTKPVDETMMNTASSTKLQDLVESEGIMIESSFYVHGEYDWIIMFTATDIQQAKRFTETLNTVYEGHIAKISLEETLFWVRRQRISNPEAKKLKEFVL
jgi:DNA-binding Lrp family transcriptional regulator